MARAREPNKKDDRTDTGHPGPRGRRGERGLRGMQGPAGPKMKAEEVLALVDDQFNLIRKQLDVNLGRMAQLQAQLDQIHGLVKKLVGGS